MSVFLSRQVSVVDPDTDVPGHQLRHQTAAEVHPGQCQVRDTQGDSIRQHPGQVQQDEGAGRGRPDWRAGAGGAGVLLRDLEDAVQQEDLHLPPGSRAVRHQTEAPGGPDGLLHELQDDVPVVVGLHQETQHHIPLLPT